MWSRYWSPLTFTFFWLVLMIVAIATRPLLPVDETRYLTVAWEMWQRGTFADYMVPHLNGATYSHKPPLLFWLMNMGWSVFGVNEWWPRLVAPLFGLVSLFLTRAIAQKLWPERSDVANFAPLVLIGAAFWTLYGTLTMFDMLVAAFTLYGLWGVLMVWRDGNRWGWVHLGLAIGLGILAKGPVILLQVLPVTLAMPLWDREKRISSYKSWYGHIGLSVIGGAVIGLAWAIPAGIMGGEEYRNAIFWGQTAGRMVHSFAHARPFWWYLSLIGPLLLPWVIWPTFWLKAVKSKKSFWTSAQMLFCLLWFVPIFFVFSLISGKQIHYLLPIFPAFAFVLSALLDDQLLHETWRSRILPGLFFVLFGAGIIALPFLRFKNLQLVTDDLSVWFVIGLPLAALLFIFSASQSARQMVIRLSSLMVVSVVMVHLAATPYTKHALELHPLSLKLKAFQDQGYDIAFVGNYHGTFQFLGRLEKSIAELETDEGQHMGDWVKAHPHGKVVTQLNQPPKKKEAVDFVQPFRSDYFVLYDLERLNGDFSLLRRR